MPRDKDKKSAYAINNAGSLAVLEVTSYAAIFDRDDQNAQALLDLQKRLVPLRQEVRTSISSRSRRVLMASDASPIPQPSDLVQKPC